MMDQTLPGGRESGAEPVIRSRLLPRISFKAMLIATTLQALVIAVIYAADQGGTYATAASVGLAFGILLIAAWMIVFQLVWAVTLMPRLVGALMVGFGILMVACRILAVPVPSPLNYFLATIWLLNFQVLGWFLVCFPIGREFHHDAESPFADEQLPPQIMAPREPSN